MEDKTERTYGNHIVQYAPDYSFCAGCTSCEVVCALTHDGLVSPCYTGYCQQGQQDDGTYGIACQHCSDHPCYDACRKKARP
jgi:Fe-S-cluster-containing hydrogenase component 2